MPDASRPFRPREPDAPPRSPESVREQVARVRRRANVRAAQSLLYVSLSTALIASSALIVLAFVLSRIPYAFAVWGAVGASLLLWGRSLAEARRSWIPQRRAAAMIDGRARLEERLTTFAAVTPPASRLWPLLLEQNLRLLPRWTPPAVVPRVVPRTVWLFILSAALAIVVLSSSGFLGSAGSSVRDTAAREELLANGDEPAGDGEELSADPGDEADSSVTAFLTALPDELRERILGSGSATQSERTIAAAKGSEPPGSGSIRPGEANSPPVSGAPMVRGKTGENAKPVGGPTDPRQATRTQRGTGERPPSAKDSPPSRGEHAKTLQRVESGRPRLPKDGERQPSAKGGGGRGASGGDGGDGEGLFGRPETGRKGQSVFELDLAGRSAEGAGPHGNEDVAALPPTELAAEQRLDDAIRRAQVPPEYEPIVQRLFRRGDEEGTPLGTR